MSALLALLSSALWGLSDFLGGSAADCKLVREKTIFYLPFNANLS